jgi:hypothetical protein
LNIIKNILYFYIDGFKGMKVGKKLWIILAIKIFIFFAILKIFFFPNILQTNFSNDKQRANFVMENLIKNK